jgi:hypothetical protein
MKTDPVSKRSYLEKLTMMDNVHNNNNHVCDNIPSSKAFRHSNNFTCYFVWVWNLVSHIKGRMQIEDV